MRSEVEAVADSGEGLDSLMVELASQAADQRTSGALCRRRVRPDRIFHIIGAENGMACVDKQVQQFVFTRGEVNGRSKMKKSVV